MKAEAAPAPVSELERARAQFAQIYAGAVNRSDAETAKAALTLFEEMERRVAARAALSDDPAARAMAIAQRFAS